MTEFPFKLSEIKLALKRKGLNYKLQNIEDCDQGTLTFLDVVRGTKLQGKLVRTFNEGEVYHWPLLNHENIAPLLDVLSIRDDMNIFLSTNLEIKLKNIIHEEDFVYDSKCFDRKRAYARGIFSGLSYLHGKSLCLMNLSDENIFICKVYDKAVITNFSCLACSRKTTRSGLKVCELYRAPETGKGEFDTMAAEIWAGGTLMLDVFLAHMFPWAIINYKPRRVLEIVDKLSMELFQAASAGSIVTTVDLAKFKAFLRCFFRENPSMRITARYASIASFLKPKFENNTLRMSFTKKIPCRDIACKARKRFIPCDHSQPPTFPSLHTNEKRDSLATKSLSKQCLSLKYFDSEHKSSNLLVDSEIPRWLVPRSTEVPNCSKRDEKYSSFLDTVSPSEKCNLISYKGESIKSIETKMGSEEKTSENETEEYKSNQLTIQPLQVYGEKDNRALEMFPRQKETSKSCQVMLEGTNVLNESSYTCYQSKSLSFIKPTADDIKNEFSIELCRSKINSYSNVKSLSLKQSNSCNWQKSDFCLNRLFRENESSQEAMIEQEEVTHESLFGPNVHDRKKFQNSKSVSLRGTFKRSVQETAQMEREANPNFGIKSDIQHITESIILLRKCQVSLKDHLRIFSNEEFAQKQRSLINEYQLLLRQEKIRLYEILRSKYALTIDEIIKIIMSVNSRSKYLRMHSKIQLTANTPDSLYELPAFKFVKYTGHNNTGIGAVNSSDREECSAVPYLRSESIYSYQRTTEKSEYRTDAQKERIPFGTENESKDKLIEKETKWSRSDAGVEDSPKVEAVKIVANCEQQVLNAKANASKNSPKAKEKKKIKKKNESMSLHDRRRNELRRPFFFSLCPGGKVEESSSVGDDLCETCKLNHKTT